MSGFPAARAWLGGFCLAIVCGSAANGTEVYQWVDRDGLTRYTIRRGPGRPQAAPAILPPIERVRPAPVEGDGLSAPGVRPAPAARPPAGAGLPVPPAVEQTAETGTPVPSARQATPPTPPEAEQIRELEARIDADRERLKQLISQPPAARLNLATDPRVLEIGLRLPKLQAELAELREAAP